MLPLIFGDGVLMLKLAKRLKYWLGVVVVLFYTLLPVKYIWLGMLAYSLLVWVRIETENDTSDTYVRVRQRKRNNHAANVSNP